MWSVVSDTVEFEGASAVRDVILHPGAVAVIALDDDDRVLLIRQYRHPVGRWLFEPPAGLLDEPDEAAWLTAARELAEESGYEAARWDVLVDFYTSPGGTSEGIRVFLARDLVALPDGRPHTGEAEEAHLPRAWVDLDEARDLVLSGQAGQPVRRHRHPRRLGQPGGRLGDRCARPTCRGPPATSWSPRTGCACLAAPEPDRGRTLRLGIPDSAPWPRSSPRLGGDHAPSGWTGHARRT